MPLRLPIATLLCRAAILAAVLHASQASAQPNSTPSPPASRPPGAEDAVPGPKPAAVPAGAVSGMGDINLYPKRIVIDDHDRVGSIGLYNRANAAGDYDLTLTELVMDEDGRLTDVASVTDPAAKARLHSAKDFLRWSPHRVTLPPNEAQMVRIIAHAPPDLPPGEYRAHFNAVAVPPIDQGLSIQQAAGDTRAAGIGVRIVPRFGISIPVVVRIGETTLTVGLTNPTVTGTGTARTIGVTVTRQGTRSAFGDITVTAAGVKAPVAQVRGVGVYTEIDRRIVRLSIDPKAPPEATAPGAHLTITYTDDDAAPGKVLARADFTVP